MILLAGVAWDWINQKLYWTDACGDDIEVYDHMTSNRRVLFDSSDGLRDPSGIVLDPTTGYVNLL
jgi:DNA-binding beta-propeller fold protein YncE